MKKESMQKMPKTSVRMTQKRTRHGVLHANLRLLDSEWKKKLTPEQYYILRKNGTETPFAGKLLHNKESGMYTCAGCGAELFSSKTKFDSGTGWPSFSAAISKNIELKEDSTFVMVRTEVVCKKCGGHLGHAFDDGPAPSGKRFCINSCALDFKKNK